MPWRLAATVVLDSAGGFVDADDAALELLGVASVEELRSISPARFLPVPPDPEAEAAWRQAYFATPAGGVLAEVSFRRLDGELVRVRTAIIDEGEGRFRALFYPIERPTTNLVPRVYRIAEVVAEWREAERRLVEVDAGSEEAAALRADIELLREQHNVMFGQLQSRAPSTPDSEAISSPERDSPQQGGPAARKK